MPMVISINPWMKEPIKSVITLMERVTCKHRLNSEEFGPLLSGLLGINLGPGQEYSISL